MTIDPNYLESTDLSIVQLKKEGLPLKKKIKEEVLFTIPSTRNLENTKLMSLYNEMLTESKRPYNAIPMDNFVFHKAGSDGNRLASKDFRILVLDRTSKIPLDVMQNCATIALLMLAGKYDVVQGYGYIRNIMEKYGSAEFSYRMNGFLIINIGKEPDISFKSSTYFTGTGL